MSRDNKRFVEVAAQLLVYFLIAGFFVAVSSLIVRFISVPETEKIETVVREVIKKENVLITQPTCEKSPEGLDVLGERGQTLQIVNNLPSHGEAGKFVGSLISTVAISGKDDIACGYLYIRASKAGQPLEDRYESLYLNPQGFGGHILLGRGISATSTGKYTEAIIPLESVSYLPSLPYTPEAKDYRIADWSRLLNVNSHVDFAVGLSTTNPAGLVEEVSIAYKCWNPSTGEETNGCLLSLSR